MAFQEAANLSIIPDVQEDAMYNYAKLSYELSYSPFNDAIKAIKEYLLKYPHSRHHDEAYSYLSKVFLSTKNYQSAIETIEEIGHKTPEITESYQRVCYYRALELYIDANYKQAIDLFDKSINNSKYDLKIRALAKYWRAESLYKIGEYEKAYNDFNDFVLTSGAYGSEEFKDAHYNIGYALFKLHDYNKAITWFRKYTDFTQSTKQTKIADAYNRIGDCYFISKNYRFAIDYYEKSIELKRRNVDYAYFQKAFSLGLLKEYNQEIDELQALIQGFPNSTYVDDAVFEMANAYKYINANDAAIENYNKIINEFKNSEYRPKAFLQAGMLDYNADKDNAAIAKFKTLIADYPKSEEAQKALVIMQNIYIDINKVDEYIDFANNNSVETEISKIKADSLTYIAAENLYMAGNCEASEPSFKNYINKYPDGRYLLNAHYYKSDCEFNQKDYKDALESYQYIIAQQPNEYTEDALLKAAFITYSDSNYQEAVKIYKKLGQSSSNKMSQKTAKIGLMRSYFRLQQYPEAIKAAMQVLTLSDDNASLEREVHYTIGKSFYETKDYDGAYAEFSLIADQAKSAEGAEANYRMIEIQYQNKDYDKAIELINKFKAANSPHQEWVARSFMVWSDIFVVKEDYFMAKATLESIIKYYPNDTDGVKDLAEEKLADIQEMELDEEALKEATEVKINMFDEGDDKLFIDDEQTPEKEAVNNPKTENKKAENKKSEDAPNTKEEPLEKVKPDIKPKQDVQPQEKHTKETPKKEEVNHEK